MPVLRREDAREPSLQSGTCNDCEAAPATSGEPRDSDYPRRPQRSHRHRGGGRADHHRRFPMSAPIQLPATLDRSNRKKDRSCSVTFTTNRELTTAEFMELD